MRAPLLRSRVVPPVAAFVAAGALPAAMILAGGPWVWAALVLLAVAGPAADAVLGRVLGEAGPDDRFPMADAGLAVLALCHLAVLAVAVARLAGDGLTVPERVALFLAAGMYAGQVGHAVGHELIHRGSRALFRLGAAVYVSILFGHHVSAHRLVHHAHVATDADPNSARPGEGFWRFFVRAWAGSFRAGLAAERARAGRLGRLNPYWWWVGGGAALMLAVACLTGPRGLADYLGLCLYAQVQVLLSDYIQHYGLRRRIGPDGRTEPVGPRHAWDSPHPLSSLMLVNAPRHADRHMNPARPYPALRLDPGRPLLPWPVAVMGAIALVPPLWRRVMDRRAARMRG